MKLKFPARQFAIGQLMLLSLSGCMSQTITPTVILETTSTPTVTEPVPPAITFIPTKNLTPEPISPEAEAYLNEFLDIFLENTINRNELNPEQVRAEAFAYAAGAQTLEDTYDTIRHILSEFANRHSFFWTTQEYEQVMNSQFSAPEGYMVDEKFGYINPGTCCGSTEDRDGKASAIQQLLIDLEAQSPCGWIVDLSRETGGDMWFAIAGLGPLIGEGRVGAFLDPYGNMLYWYYQAGGTGVEGFPPIVQVSIIGLVLSTPEAPVAVLISRFTGSAGEAIAIAFRGRKNTRFFGHPTFGLTTSNSPFELSDGAVLVLTTAVFVDRTGQVYGDKIIPDEPTYTGFVTDDVKNWLLSQPACSNP